MAKMLVTLEIDVVPLSEEEQRECSEQMGNEEIDEEDGPGGDLGFLPEDYYAFELAEVLEGAFHEDAVKEMFAGSGIFVTFDGATVKSAEWMK